MISINSLSVEFSSQVLFDSINYVINPKDKIALVGKNGAGKSTMLKIIAGRCDKEEPDPIPPIPTTASRTVLVYMAADNNLGSGGYDTAAICIKDF